MERKRIGFDDWRERLDTMLQCVLDRTTESFGLVDWETFYNEGFSPGDLTDAILVHVQLLELAQDFAETAVN